MIKMDGALKKNSPAQASDQQQQAKSVNAGSKPAMPMEHP